MDVDFDGRLLKQTMNETLVQNHRPEIHHICIKFVYALDKRLNASLDILKSSSTNGEAQEKETRELSELQQEHTVLSDQLASLRERTPTDAGKAFAHNLDQLLQCTQQWQQISEDMQDVREERALEGHFRSAEFQSALYHLRGKLNDIASLKLKLEAVTENLKRMMYVLERSQSPLATPRSSFSVAMTPQTTKAKRFIAGADDMHIDSWNV